MCLPETLPQKLCCCKVSGVDCAHSDILGGKLCPCLLLDLFSVLLAHYMVSMALHYIKWTNSLPIMLIKHKQSKSEATHYSGDTSE